MNRIDLIKNLIEQKNLKNYLEIGVFNGHAFFKIKSTFKIAIDPEFRFGMMRKTGKLFTNPYNLFNKYYSTTSDDFFSKNAPEIFKNAKINLSLIDGMHEYLFALRDAENVLNYLSDDGVIIMHDCNPLTESAAKTFEEWQKDGAKTVWNGDVWKAILHLRSTRNDVDVFVLDCDHGLGIITKRKPENNLSFTPEQIQAMTYNDLAANRKELLNLKPAKYVEEYFGLVS